LKPCPDVNGRAEQAAEKMQQSVGKGFLQGPFVPQDKLKPVESTQFTSALKHRPPEEIRLFPQTVKTCADVASQIHRQAILASQSSDSDVSARHFDCG